MHNKLDYQYIDDSFVIIIDKKSNSNKLSVFWETPLILVKNSVNIHEDSIPYVGEVLTTIIEKDLLVQHPFIRHDKYTEIVMLYISLFEKNNSTHIKCFFGHNSGIHTVTSKWEDVNTNFSNAFLYNMIHKEDPVTLSLKAIFDSYKEKALKLKHYKLEVPSFISSHYHSLELNQNIRNLEQYKPYNEQLRTRVLNPKKTDKNPTYGALYAKTKVRYNKLVIEMQKAQEYYSEEINKTSYTEKAGTTINIIQNTIDNLTKLKSLMPHNDTNHTKVDRLRSIQQVHLMNIQETIEEFKNIDVFIYNDQKIKEDFNTQDKQYSELIIKMTEGYKHLLSKYYFMKENIIHVFFMAANKYFDNLKLDIKLQKSFGKHIDEQKFIEAFDGFVSIKAAKSGHYYVKPIISKHTVTLKHIEKIINKNKTIIERNGGYFKKNDRLKCFNEALDKISHLNVSKEKSTFKFSNMFKEQDQQYMRSKVDILKEWSFLYADRALKLTSKYKEDKKIFLYFVNTYNDKLEGIITKLVEMDVFQSTNDKLQYEFLTQQYIMPTKSSLTTFSRQSTELKKQISLAERNTIIHERIFSFEKYQELCNELSKMITNLNLNKNKRNEERIQELTAANDLATSCVYVKVQNDYINNKDLIDDNDVCILWFNNMKDTLNPGSWRRGCKHYNNITRIINKIEGEIKKTRFF
ncbi:hypothetical protein [Francisella adeliensis]|uniref:Uncharacterized protein n=1 Tax=Francisella adeliensis TaxID=2007306 RepID=A0A2Z4Y112_9GAMM|nr:hypothetical protein [Francisella adeliensis]AXA34568.1 hypothetical protein CDH04_09250 [Francisella adeliensis]MBK2086292.1 hypothetical protein [Francisella adeliensis]MBK2096508.1 hypothetical protein [Francisella adeliensis]QIW12814.1 hypothetical protein FZC43_09265 [Francisella adeliensis]QIW14691.1 hypothetical protein FZC44_09255 [Francisella adeliensis]